MRAKPEAWHEIARCFNLVTSLRLVMPVACGQAAGMNLVMLCITVHTFSVAEILRFSGKRELSNERNKQDEPIETNYNYQAEPNRAH